MSLVDNFRQLKNKNDFVRTPLPQRTKIVEIFPRILDILINSVLRTSLKSEDSLPSSIRVSAYSQCINQRYES